MTEDDEGARECLLTLHLEAETAKAQMLFGAHIYTPAQIHWPQDIYRTPRWIVLIMERLEGGELFEQIAAWLSGMLPSLRLANPARLCH